MLNPHDYAVTGLGPGRSVLHMNCKIIYPSRNQFSNGIRQIKNLPILGYKSLDSVHKILAKTNATDKGKVTFLKRGKNEYL